MKIKQLENNIIFYACMFAGLLLLSSTLDNDCWFLLNHGRYVMEHGIPHIEPFTIHENFSFVMQQWLTGVIFWEIYKCFGVDGLMLLLYPVAIMNIYAVYRLGMLVSNDNKDAAMVLSSIAGVFICLLFITNRPQIFSTLIFIIEIIGLEYMRKSSDKICLLLFPFLSILLINLHAAMWPMMIVFLLPFFTEHLARYDIKGYFAKEKKVDLYYLCAIFVLIVLAGFANPYGLEAMTYVFRSYGYDMISNIVSEMRPITLRSGLGIVVHLLFLFVIAIYVRHKLMISHMLLTMGTMVMALSSIRSLYLFLAVGLYPLAYVYREWQGFSWENTASHDLRLRKLLMLMISGVFVWAIVKRWEYICTAFDSLGIIIVSVVFISLLVFLTAEWKYGRLHFVKDVFLRCGYVTITFILCFFILISVGHKSLDFKEPSNSAKAVDYILEHEDSRNVRLWTGYNDGPYPEFRGLRCFLDTRAEVFLPSNNKQRDVFYEYYSLETGKTDYRTFLSWYDFNYILVSENSIMYTYLPSDENYELVLHYQTKDEQEFCLYHVKE